MKPLLFCLLAALVLQASTISAHACQYCRLAATDPEAARLAAEIHAKAGGFPLDSALSRFQAAVPSAVLTAPPPAANIATSTADLPAAVPHRSLPPVVARPSVAIVPATTNASASPIPAKNAADRWADGGLLGLCGLAGVFGWRTRTRRTGRAVS